MTLALILLVALAVALVTPIGVTHGVASLSFGGLTNVFTNPLDILGGGGGGQSGIGNSQSASASTTQNIDKRIVSQGGTNVSADSATVNVTDQGAVHEAFGFATQALNQSLAKSSDAINAALQQFDQQSAALKDAYTEAKAGEQKVLVVAALALLAIVGGVVVVRFSKGG